MNGVLVIDKPADITSHDVVNQVRHILHVRRVGHTGTLDPFATGLMVILIGRATRLAQFLSGLEKEYEAVIRLGYATDTGDGTGERIEDETLNAKGPWDEKQIEDAMAGLRGDIDQVPPMFSAKKQGGRKLYELARQGLSVEREPVQVSIHLFEPIRGSGELLQDNLDGTFDLQVRVSCSSGTYIRTLAEDFGKRLKVGAHVVELRRTKIGDLQLDESHSLGQVKEALGEESLGRILLRPDDVLSRLPYIDLNDDDLKRVRNGLDVRVVAFDWSDNAEVRMRDSNKNLIGVGIFSSVRKTLHPAVVIANE
jgi:tRNA pseudouridine55 synthase